jgi:ADP-ribose pyrophosphatase YjhB (NUDIX family)
MQFNKHSDILYYTAAGGVLVDSTGTQVLLLIRPSRDEVRLPKGHIEMGETLECAALREVREETGYIDIDIMDNLGEQLVAFQYDGRQIQRTETYFLMRTRSKEQCSRPETDEDQFFPTWVEWDTAEQVITYEAEREWLQRARAKWKQG